MKQPRFIPWKGPEILEKDLPPGVRYAYTDSIHACQVEYISEASGACVEVQGGDGQPCFRFMCPPRTNTPVTILDWPDHCGPRPCGFPTWGEIGDGSPSEYAQCVFRYGAETTVGARARDIDPHSSSSRPGGEFLGYLVWEDSDE